MSAVPILIEALQHRGVSLAVDGEMLKLRAPKGGVSPDELSLLQQHKVEIIALLRQWRIRDVEHTLRAWAAGIAGLNPERPPGDMPGSRWHRFISDAQGFIESGWSTRAALLGWDALELFGCDHKRPFARIDNMGLIWVLNGRKLLAVTACDARIENRCAEPHTFQRRIGEVVRTVIAWRADPV